jgi:flagellar protein FlaG
MSQSAFQPQPAHVEIVKTADYREGYSNSIQVRANLWDFLLVFGTLNQTSPDSVSIEVFQGIYLSPQQAKALTNVLQQNIRQYEATFGTIRLEPISPEGAVQ